MPKCKFCGRELAEGERCTCPQSVGPDLDERDYFKIPVNKNTIARVRETLATAGETISARGSERDYTARAVDGAFEKGLKIDDQCIVPTEQEIPVRQYDIARLNTPLWKRAFGRLQITNKRVLFRAAGKSLVGPVIIEKEFSLEEIGGIEVKTDYRFDWLIFLLSGLGILCLTGIYVLILSGIVNLVDGKKLIPSIFAILTIVGTLAFCFLVLRKRTWKAAFLTWSYSACFLLGAAATEKFWVTLGVVLALAAVVMWILSAIVDDLQISIKIKGAHAAIEISRKLIKDERSGFKIVQPWTDTSVAIRELGALIDDVKRFGDAGIAKWKG